jgi:hypothetical protein
VSILFICVYLELKSHFKWIFILYDMYIYMLRFAYLQCDSAVPLIAQRARSIYYTKDAYKFKMIATRKESPKIQIADDIIL